MLNIHADGKNERIKMQLSVGSPGYVVSVLWIDVGAGICSFFILKCILIYFGVGDL